MSSSTITLRRSRGVFAVSLVGLLLGVAGCGDTHVESPATSAPREEPTPTSAAPPAVEDSELLLIFADAVKGEEVVSDSNTGNLPVKVDVATAGGGSLRGATGPAGLGAVRLPAWSASDPANAILRVRNAGAHDVLSPDEAAFSFGADFALDAQSEGSTVDDGDNLVQRGLFDASSQYKIQIDHGRVSCRVAGLHGAVIVKMDRPVETRAWYRVRCTRRADTVSISLLKLHGDAGPPVTASESGPIGSVVMSAPTPLSVGGKLAIDGKVISSSSDQFNGLVDRVVFRLLK